RRRRRRGRCCPGAKSPPARDRPRLAARAGETSRPCALRNPSPSDPPAMSWTTFALASAANLPWHGAADQAARWAARQVLRRETCARLKAANPQLACGSTLRASQSRLQRPATRREGAKDMSLDVSADKVADATNGGAHADAGFWPLTLGSLGVVYGDIGTSPLYAFRESVTAATGSGNPVSEPIVLGILSLIIWSLILIVTVKYIII